MSSTLWRRVFLALYLLVMSAASLFILGRTFAAGEMVQIDDQEAVMRRRTSSVLTRLTIDDPCWPAVEITGRELLFSLTQQMNAIPRVKGQFPGEAPGKLSGQMAFADGTQEDFSISTVLTIGQRVYYSPEAQTQLENIRQLLASHLYTLENLASFFYPRQLVTLSDGEASLALSSESMGLLRRAIEEGALVEDSQEVEQLVGGPPPGTPSRCAVRRGWTSCGWWSMPTNPSRSTTPIPPGSPFSSALAGSWSPSARSCWRRDKFRPLSSRWVESWGGDGGFVSTQNLPAHRGNREYEDVRCCPLPAGCSPRRVPE